MNDQHRAIREQIRSMSPKRAAEYIKGFELPEDEERYLIACDVRNRSCTEVAMENHVSPDLIKKKRRRAYGKIAYGTKDKEAG